MIHIMLQRDGLVVIAKENLIHPCRHVLFDALKPSIVVVKFMCFIIFDEQGIKKKLLATVKASLSPLSGNLHVFYKKLGSGHSAKSFLI